MEFRNPSTTEPMHMSAQAIPNARHDVAHSFRSTPASSSARTSSASATPAALVPDPALPSSSSTALVPSAAVSLAERIAAAEAGIIKSLSEEQLLQLERQPKQGAWHVVDAGVLQVVVPSTVHLMFWNTSNLSKTGMGWAYVQLVPVEERPGGGGGGGGGSGRGWRDRVQRKLASAVQKLEGLFQGN